MTDVATGSNTILGIKKQVALGTPISGAGAALINVRPSPGLALQVATIESTMIHRSGMKGRARQGFGSAPNISYETELQVGNLDLPFEGVLGHVDAAVTLSQVELTSVVISGTGTLLTFGGGDLYALGPLYAGRWVKFANLATSGNNGVWVPILSVPTATTATIPTGYLVDEGSDSTFSMTISKSFRTQIPRPKDYYSVEEYLDIDQSKFGPDARFTGLNFGAAVNQDVTAGFTLAGLDLQHLASAAAPNFTSPVDGTIAGAESMTMLDGALLVNGVDLLEVTGLTMGISAQSQITPLLRQRRGLSVGLQGFGFAGQISTVLTDTSTAFADFLAESPLAILAGFRQGASLSSDFVGVFVPNAAYGNWNAPITDFDMIATLPLYAGRETRLLSAGYPEGSILVVSTSAP